jgi:hypothetical protein
MRRDRGALPEPVAIPDREAAAFRRSPSPKAVVAGRIAGCVYIHFAEQPEVIYQGKRDAIHVD